MNLLKRAVVYICTERRSTVICKAFWCVPHRVWRQTEAKVWSSDPGQAARSLTCQSQAPARGPIWVQHRLQSNTCNRHDTPSTPGHEHRQKISSLWTADVTFRETRQIRLNLFLHIRSNLQRLLNRATGADLVFSTRDL